MSIPVTELTPGERVTLFCPNARRDPRQAAVFEAILTRAEVMAIMQATGSVLMEGSTLKNTRFAVFLTQTIDPRPLIFTDPFGTGAPAMIQLRHVMEVTDAGEMKDDEGRAVYIEARVAMGVG